MTEDFVEVTFAAGMPLLITTSATALGNRC